MFGMEWNRFQIGLLDFRNTAENLYSIPSGNTKKKSLDKICGLGRSFIQSLGLGESVKRRNQKAAVKAATLTLVGWQFRGVIRVSATKSQSAQAQQGVSAHRLAYQAGQTKPHGKVPGRLTPLKD